jgi:hypothetical protein
MGPESGGMTGFYRNGTGMRPESREMSRFCRNRTGICHKRLTGCPKLTQFAIFNIKDLFIYNYIIVCTI